jgi:hypothetical protein
LIKTNKKIKRIIPKFIQIIKQPNNLIEKKQKKNKIKGISLKKKGPSKPSKPDPI